MRTLGWDAALAEVGRASDAGRVNKLSPNDFYRLSKIVAQAQLGIDEGSEDRGYFGPKNQLDYRGAFLFPSDRLSLYERVNRRCEKMVADGFLEEVARLLHLHGDKPMTIPVVGYRQAIAFLTQSGDPTVYDFQQFMGKFAVTCGGFFVNLLVSWYFLCLRRRLDNMLKDK